jgi:hypothetical protein
MLALKISFSAFSIQFAIFSFFLSCDLLLDAQASNFAFPFNLKSIFLFAPIFWSSILFRLYVCFLLTFSAFSFLNLTIRLKELKEKTIVFCF